MCGINIIVDKTKNRFGPEAIQKMNAALRHRGPDGDPHFEKIELDWATVWLGATRLAIRGGKEGQQPVHSPSGRFTLVHNGEIYNLAEHGGADTTALAQALEQHTTTQGSLDLNGMYAFSYINHQSQALHINRDRIGIKPLFQLKTGYGYAFSSEAEGLLALQLVDGGHGPAQPQAAVVLNWLGRRHPGPDATFWQGCSLVSEVGIEALSEPKIMADDVFEPGLNIAPSVKPRSLKPLMLEALERQLVSDRPVGLMLSGGYDSAFLLACLVEMGCKIPCYTLAGTPDAGPAAQMTKKLGFEHRLVSMPAGWQDLETYMQNKLHPIADSGGFTTWLVARAAKQDGVPVLLSGAGADELLGGYRRHRAFYMLQRLGLQWLSTHRQASVFNRMVAWKGLGHLSKTKTSRVDGPRSDYNSPFDPRFLEMEDYLRGDILMVTDQATMAHGVEGRVPFLDNAIVKELLGIPWMELMQEEYKAPLVPALKEAGLFDLLLKKKTGFGLWDTAIFNGLPVLERLLDRNHALYQYLDFKKAQKELRSGSPHARFSIAQLAYTLEFIWELKAKRL